MRTIDTLDRTAPRPLSFRSPSKLYRAIIEKKLQGFERGELTISDGASSLTFGRATEQFPLKARIHVHDPRFYEKVVFGGTVGAGESYALGYWSSDDLTPLIRLFILNRTVMMGMEKGLARLLFPLLKSYHLLNRNTRSGSRKNIEAHYDLGNDFFQLFLDPTMMYSAAFFSDQSMTLEEASTAKNERLCRKLQLSPGDHLLEIGTGWGSFAIHAAKNYGCQVTTTTISKEQYDYARERIQQEGLEDRVTLLLKDYRDLQGKYTKLASIEMIEAVGWQFYKEFFRHCDRLLAEDGVAAIQAITIQDQNYDQARRSVDFIQRFIFPGSCIPSMTALLSAATEASFLKLFHFEDFAPHYARTLKEWRTRFMANADQILALGYSREFLRLWEFYFCYCEGGFAERSIGSTQLVLTKPLCRINPISTAIES